MEESTSLNIIYLPDEATRNKAIEISRKVSSQLPTEFTLGQDRYPHITIYQARFPNKNIGQLKKIIDEIAHKTRLFEIEMCPFAINVVRGFVWWNCIKTDDLARTHLETISRVNPLREGLVPEGLKTYPATEGDKKDIKNYGSLLVGEHYFPHITITRLKNSEDKEKAQGILGEGEYSVFGVDKIVLGQMGDHGTVTEIIEEFPLV